MTVPRLCFFECERSSNALSSPLTGISCKGWNARPMKSSRAIALCKNLQKSDCKVNTLEPQNVDTFGSSEKCPNAMQMLQNITILISS